MPPHLLLRVHTDLRSGLGCVARALVLVEHWRALGGACTLAVTGDERARRIGAGKHPLLEEALPCPAVDLGENPQAAVPEALKGQAAVVLVDLGEATAEQLQALRPLRVAVMEDAGDAHEQADLLFQPFLEGISWPSTPVKTLNGRKVRPSETMHGRCRVLRGSAFIVVSPATLQRRPKREPLQPLAVHKLLVTFDGTDGAGLAQRAHQVLARLVAEGRWEGTCTLVTPERLPAVPFPGCRILESGPSLPQKLQSYDAVWCAGGATLAEALCLGVPVALWARNEHQHLLVGDLALANGCYNLGIGPEAEQGATEDALEQWLGPEGQETRQEQTRDGMQLVDGMGGGRVAQELWALGQDTKG
jgi:spore coat polysaccharide biosynthesis predicted glycosyltransferase SpsG